MPAAQHHAAPPAKVRNLGAFVATAYGPPWGGIEGGQYGQKSSKTSTGLLLTTGVQKLAVAVDPSVIPYGSKLRISPNPFGDDSLVFTASDTGGAIKGNRLDFAILRGKDGRTTAESLRAAQNGWGRRRVHVQLVGKGSPLDAATLDGSGRGHDPTSRLVAGPIGATGSPPADQPQDAWSGAGIFAPLFRGVTKALVWTVLILGGALLVVIGAGRALGRGKGAA